MTKGGKTFAYSYGADGVRTQKTVDGVTTEYYTVGGKLLAEKTGDRVLTFYYDDQDRPVSVELNGTRYYYRQNLQGDVIGLYSGGAQVVSYTYDPWGKLLNITDTSGTNIGTLNPLRYRGYYYDTETGFYFLQSRYYDPTVGRFINADGYVSTGQGISSYNMFAYCLNDPVNMSDTDGKLAAEAGFLAWSLAAGGANAWNPVGWVILLGGTIVIIGILIIPWDRIGQSISNTWNQVKSRAKTISRSRSISKSMSKTKAKIQKEKKKYDYWIASYVDYGDGAGTYIATDALSFSRAISYVRAGGSVFADSRGNAYRLALAVGNGRIPSRPEIHHDKNGSTLGYWWHYHAGGRKGGHIFYV